MDLKHYLYIINGNKWVILLTMIITVVVTTLITFMITPVYTASTTLRVATASTGSVGYSDYMYADRLMNTYTRIATSGPVLQELAEKLHLKSLPEIVVATIPNTELIKITVESSSPIIAKDSANALADILIEQGKEFYAGGGKSTQEILSEQVKQAEDELNLARQAYDKYVSENPNDTSSTDVMRNAIQLKENTYATLLEQYDQARLREMIRANIISVVEPSSLPSRPSKPNKLVNISLGFIVGLAGGFGLAFVLESLSNRLYTSKQIEAIAKMNVVGQIPLKEGKWPVKWLRGSNEDNNDVIFNEAFRKLYVKLSMLNQNGSGAKLLKTIMITSAEPGEGKSTIILNLALATAQSGKKVIIVDCDLHLPRQHKIHELPNKAGLSTVLNQKKTVEETVRKTRYPGLFVLTSGPAPRDPLKLLESPQMSALIMKLAQQYDMVLLDTPALLPTADAALLTCLVDGVVMVVRRNLVREINAKEACRQLADMKAPMVGVVINDAELNGADYYYRSR
jgi:non-specific protein-tyrosine kinase